MKSSLKLVDIAMKSSYKQTVHCIFDWNTGFLTGILDFNLLSILIFKSLLDK